MTDSRLRALERSASTGDPGARAALIAERLRRAAPCGYCGGNLPISGRGLYPERVRVAGVIPCSLCAGTGSPYRARVELAAYCGDQSARATLPAPCPNGCGPVAKRMSCWACHSPNASIPTMVSGILRFADIGPVSGWVLIRAAVAAAREALTIWELAELGSNWPDDEETDFRAPRTAVKATEMWLDCPCEPCWSARHVAYVEAGHLAWLPTPWDAGVRDSIAACARLAGEPAVRAAISSALISWALGDS